MSDDLSMAFRVLSDQFAESGRTWRFWGRTQGVLLIAQFGALIYDFTLPAFLMLSMPFFWCFLLACIPLHLVGRKRDALLIGMHVVTDEMRRRNDEQYRLITGEARR